MDKEQVEMLEEQTSKEERKRMSFNLTIATIIIVFYIGLQVLRGNIELDNLFGNKYLPADYKPKKFFEDLYDKIINLKEYLIFFFILSVIFIIIHKSNLEYEKELIIKNKGIQKKNSNLETILEETTENEEKEKND